MDKPIRARKRFGQNFLQDKQVIQSIVDAIHPQPDANLVEIGPGLGALTQALLPTVSKLHVVELDRDLIPHLEQRCAALGDLHIHQADALEFDFLQLVEKNQKLRIVGNLPYNISTPLIFHLLNTAEHIDDMHFMLQKEVVARMAAKPGNKQYGRLSVMTQYDCRVTKLFDVPPEAFSPAPKVMSAVVRLQPHATRPYIANATECLAEVVRIAFSHRRKTLQNSLRSVLTVKQICAADVDPTTRPESLSVAQFVALANQLSR